MYCNFDTRVMRTRSSPKAPLRAAHLHSHGHAQAASGRGCPICLCFVLSCPLFPCRLHFPALSVAFQQTNNANALPGRTNKINAQDNNWCASVSREIDLELHWRVQLDTWPHLSVFRSVYSRRVGVLVVATSLLPPNSPQLRVVPSVRTQTAISLPAAMRSMEPPVGNSSIILGSSC